MTEDGGNTQKPQKWMQLQCINNYYSMSHTVKSHQIGWWRRHGLISRCPGLSKTEASSLLNLEWSKHQNAFFKKKNHTSSGVGLWFQGRYVLFCFFLYLTGDICLEIKDFIRPKNFFKYSHWGTGNGERNSNRVDEAEGNKAWRKIKKKWRKWAIPIW